MKNLKEQNEFTKILDLGKEEIASLNNEELSILKGGKITVLCNDTETTPACLTIDPKIGCI